MAVLWSQARILLENKVKRHLARKDGKMKTGVVLAGVVALFAKAAGAAECPPGCRPYSRPAAEKRTLRSETVDRAVAAVAAKIGDQRIRKMFEACYPNTLDTTVKGKGYVITGDIDAMWLRDSGQQVWPYLRFAKDDPAVRNLVRDLLVRQFDCLLHDPYANAFYDDEKRESQWKSDKTEMKPGVHERKYELDSLCYPLRLAHGYWKATGDKTPFGDRWLDAVGTVLATMREQQRKGGQRTSYRFERENAKATDTLTNAGWGPEVKPVGLIASAFRPSDDSCTYPFLVPSNFFAADVLEKTAEVLESANGAKRLADECRALAGEVREALRSHAVVKTEKYGEIYAFEVDGRGGALLMDDANAPSLLSLPYLCGVDKDDPVYLNTRRFVLSRDNPFWFEGKALKGIGSPHTEKGRVWPMSIIMRALTAQTSGEAKECLSALANCTAGTGFMHEGVDADDPAKYSRSWFAWANTLFGELVWNMVSRGEIEPPPNDLSSWVRPEIGTGGNGHAFPGAAYPFGLVQAGPDTGCDGWGHCSGYRFEEKEIKGFSQTHLSGTGCTDLGDFLFFPYCGPSREDGFSSDFDKGSETMEPGYYAVDLGRSRTRVEVSVSPHCAIYRFTFLDGGGANIMFDNQWAIGDPGRDQMHDVKISDDGRRRFEGEKRRWGWVHRTFAFSLEFDRDWSGFSDLPATGGRRDAGRRNFRFDMKRGETLTMKIGLSSVSPGKARRNLDAEIPGWDFAKTKADARAAWNGMLSKMTAKGGAAELETFYTALYHLFLQPVNMADVDGEYRGDEDIVKKSPCGEYYSTFSFWDTFRAANPLYTILVPEKIAPMVASCVEHQSIAGFLPIWALWGKDNQCMIGTHSIPLLADAYFKGLLGGNDPERVYRAIRATLRENHPRRQKENWDVLDRYGYYPFDKIRSESVSRLLECAYDDWCAAKMAKALGHADDARFFAKRAGYWKNVIDPSTGFARGRDSAGNWREPFNPFALGHDASRENDFTEGNSWQWTWHVLHDPEGLAAALGGKAKAASKLEALFAQPEKAEGMGFTSDVTGLIGQYAHGNEPGHHTAYLFRYFGKGWRTEELVREICDKFYRAAPDGLCGNEDCGQMSAWYLLSAAGFYPLNPASGEYVLGAPQLPKVSFDVGNGKRFTVLAKNLSRENKYVKSVRLNGRPLAGFVLRHKDVAKGGKLEFEMSPVRERKGDR